MPITIPILRSKSVRHQPGIVIAMARNPQPACLFVDVKAAASRITLKVRLTRRERNSNQAASVD